MSCSYISLVLGRARPSRTWMSRPLLPGGYTSLVERDGPPFIETPMVNTAPSTVAKLSGLLREWDKGGKTVRTQILADFVAQCRLMTGPQLERALGNGASLLLARISSWLRLSYALGSGQDVPS